MITLEFSLVAGGVLLAIKWLSDNKWTYPIIRKILGKLQNLLPGTRNEKTLKKILAELIPNGGGSLKDTVGRIEYRLIENHKMVQILLKMQRLHEENEGIATFLTDSKGRCIYANQNYLRLAGLTMEEVIRTGWKNCIPQEEREEVFKNWKASIEEGVDFHMHFSYINYTNGEEVPIRCDAYLIRDDKEIIGWVGYLTRIHQ
jgi:PAS domain S-box-containing protein